MINGILHRITNRVNDFDNLCFYDDGSYIPVPETWGLRASLGLLDLSTDFYIISALAAINAFPEIKSEFGADYPSYDLSKITPEVPAVTGAQLVANAFGPPVVHRRASEFPVDFVTLISWAAQDQVRVEIGGVSRTLPARISGSRLMVDWDAASGITGDLVCDSPWSGESLVQITSTPWGFPYAAVLAATDTAERRDALSRAGLMEQFYLAGSDAERLAVLCLIL